MEQKDGKKYYSISVEESSKAASDEEEIEDEEIEDEEMEDEEGETGSESMFLLTIATDGKLLSKSPMSL